MRESEKWLFENLDKEKQEGIIAHQQEFNDRCDAIARMHNYISSARQKAIDFVAERSRRIKQIEEWNKKYGDKN